MGAGVLNYSIRLSAHPSSIVADGESSTVITAEVRDQDGRAVSDGTIVDFSTSLGEMERRAPTTAGTVRVVLQSANRTGSALVSALVAGTGAVGQIRVEFVEQGTQISPEAYVLVSSPKYLGYDEESRKVDAAGGVTIVHRGVRITAEEAQIDVAMGTLRARGLTARTNVTIERGDRSIEASALFYDFGTATGVLISPPEAGARRMRLRGADLYVEPEENAEKSPDVDFTPATGKKMFVRAESMVIRPGEEVKLKKARFYYEGERVLSMPLYRMSLRDSSVSADRVFGYGSEGLRLDVPFYYSLTPSTTGSLRVKRSEPTGWGYYSGRRGWQVDLMEEYDINGEASGRFVLNRIGFNDWGARWNHQNDLGNGARIHSYIDFPSHRDLYGSVDYNRSYRSHSASLSLRAHRLYEGDDRMFANGYVQSRTRRLGLGGIIYSVSARAGYDGQPGLGHRRLRGGMGMQLYGPQIQFGPYTGLSTSANVSRNWGGTSPGALFAGSAGMYSELRGGARAGVNYNYSWADGRDRFTAETLSADLFMTGRSRWGARLSAIRGIRDNSISSFGELGYNLARDWSLSALTTRQRFTGATYSDVQIALVRALGVSEARLMWSKARDRFLFEFSSSAY